MDLPSDDMSVSGRWTAQGDTDGDVREKVEFHAAGPVTCAFPPVDVTHLGQVAAAISGKVELGSRGEAL